MSLQPLRFGDVKLSEIQTALEEGRSVRVKDRALSQRAGRDVLMWVDGYDSLTPDDNGTGHYTIELAVRHESSNTADTQFYTVTGVKLARHEGFLEEALKDAEIQGLDLMA